jgi:hypothetical protein
MVTIKYNPDSTFDLEMEHSPIVRLRGTWYVEGNTICRAFPREVPKGYSGDQAGVTVCRKFTEWRNGQLWGPKGWQRKG